MHNWVDLRHDLGHAVTLMQHVCSVNLVARPFLPTQLRLPILPLTKPPAPRASPPGRQVSGLKSITAKHLALSCQCLGAFMALHPALAALFTQVGNAGRSRAWLAKEAGVCVGMCCHANAAAHSCLIIVSQACRVPNNLQMYDRVQGVLPPRRDMLLADFGRALQVGRGCVLPCTKCRGAFLNAAPCRACWGGAIICMLGTCSLWSLVSPTHQTRNSAASTRTGLPHPPRGGVQSNCYFTFPPTFLYITVALSVQDYRIHHEEVCSKLVAIMRERLSANIKQLPALAAAWPAGPTRAEAPAPSSFATTAAKQLQVREVGGRIAGVPATAAWCLPCCNHNEFSGCTALACRLLDGKHAGTDLLIPDANATCTLMPITPAAPFSTSSPTRRSCRERCPRCCCPPSCTPSLAASASCSAARWRKLMTCWNRMGPHGSSSCGQTCRWVLLTASGWQMCASWEAQGWWCVPAGRVCPLSPSRGRFLPRRNRGRPSFFPCAVPAQLPAQPAYGPS